jgi:hypothetical protein
MHWPELQSVDFTAAAKDNCFQLAGDATAISKHTSQVAGVRITAASFCKSQHASEFHSDAS